MDSHELELLAQTLTKTMTSVPSGAPLREALVELGWRELLAEEPDVAIPLVFRLLGETGADAPLLDDVTGAEPFPAGRLAAGRRAAGWWLLGSGRAMLDLARAHATGRVQFGKPIASFQAVRHKLAETYVALEGAQAALAAAGPDELSSLLAKAAAGRAALLAAKHCQQVLGGIGFTAEHPFHLHLKRVLVLDVLLGSTRELTREAGRAVISSGAAPRLVDL